LKSGKRVFIAAALMSAGVLGIRGELAPWVQHVSAGPALQALFSTVNMPGGAVPILLPPVETRPALTKLITSSPQEVKLYRLRAQEDEVALDFTAAEEDWKTYAAKAADRYEAELELAGFYDRRIRPREELATLIRAAAAKDDRTLPATEQRGWKAFVRAAAVVQNDAVPAVDAEHLFRAWVARYPNEFEAWRKLIGYLIAQNRFPAAETEIASYGRKFNDAVEPVKMRADLELRRGSVDAALAIYDKAFQPLWPEDMYKSYFKLLQDHGQLREFTGRARKVLEANPTDVDATARLFHYFQSQNKAAAARRVLLEYRIAKEASKQPWTPDELLTLAQLFQDLPDVNEQARLYYALYSTPQQERALYELAHLLLANASGPIQFGSGDLSFYKDIATLDPSPGFLNGILSLLLNWTEPRGEYQNQNVKSAAYFHCATGARLVSLLDQRFPKSAYRDPLHAALISAYASYGDDATVIRAGREYLAKFPKGNSRVSVAMQIAAALARADRTAEEFALYDRMLRELGARSGEYTQVLDQYLSRLASLNRPLDGLRVYRTEIDRNPNAANLYERLAAFLEQNGMSRDVEAVYTKALAKFADRSWYDKLARWYLRRKEFDALEKISRDAVAVFSGTELESYFAQIVAQTHPEAALYLRLNLYAHDRFPEDLAFVHNLFGAYSQPGTADGAAAERLLRQYWFYDPQLKSMLFQTLSAQGRLYPELAQIRAANPGIVSGQLDQTVNANPAAVQFATEAEAWLSHFEAAAPAARALATSYPGKREFTARASALYRSLAAYDPRDTDVAVSLASLEQRADPRDQSILARIGDILADRELFDRAKPFWDRMPAEQPGKPDAYLDAATVFWDYYRYTDALRLIAEARKKFNDPALFAYQAGAIDENKRDYASAVREYVAGALHGGTEANSRLLYLLNRPATRVLIDRATAAAMVSNASPEAVDLRIAVLEAEQRRPEIEALLRSRVDAERSPVELSTLQETARRLGFEAIEEQAAERLAAISNDPVDKMRLTLAYARLLESKKDLAGGARIVDTLYRDHPLILGVVRGAVDFHVRNHQPVEAIDILLEASKLATAGLSADFTLESARIATAAGQYDRARGLLAGLLAADPLRAEYLTAMADTYLQAKDDRGFEAYELATIQILKQSKLTPPQRVERIATVRRSLIPALERLKDSSGALDQYIEVLNSYPEDDQLTKEAAAYAVAHGQAAKLVAFYRKTIAAAPLDYRWPIVLARIETVTEDYPAAIADYERGMNDRPDRADLVEAKARLEERLMRFDDAIHSYSKLCELAYRDPQWLIKVAELDARTGRNSEAVNALKTAMIGARTETADTDFDIAERLESWHILADAVSFAERGANRAGPDLFKDIGHAVAYARILVRARKMDAVLARVGSNPLAVEQIRQAVGKVVDETYTPEEKSRLEQLLNARGDADLPLVQACGLVDLEARQRLESMLRQAVQLDQRFVTLQSQRGRYAELGRQLEGYAARNPGRQVEAAAWADSAQAFIAEGDLDAQLRVLHEALVRNALAGPLLDRYLELTASRQPEKLLEIVRNYSPQTRNRAVQFAIAGDYTKLSYSAIQARGSALTPVWTKAYTALAGEYFDDRSPAIDSSFQSALDTRTIGERLKKRLSSGTVIVGSVWFYYGARYGDYLLAGKNAEAKEWLPASLEAAPGDPQAYMALGDSLAAAGESAQAIAQFKQALVLDPDRGDAHDHIALVMWSEGRKTEAIAEWRSAMATFLKIQSAGVRVPEPFWGRVAETFTDIGERQALGELRGDIAHLLGDYYQRNGEYRLDELIQPAARASIVSGVGTAWLLDLGRSLNGREMILNALMRLPELTDEQRISLQRDLVALLDRQVQGAFGDNHEYVANQAAGARLRLITMQLDAGDVQGAVAEWSLVPVNRDSLRDQVEIRLAAQTGSLDALLERYRREPDSAPSVESLRNAALVLRNLKDEPGARSVLAFLYGREIRAGHLDAANFLGLAEVDLQRNETAPSVALLNRMALVVDDGFETLLPAADLLGRYGKTAESADFLRRRIKAVPWDADAKVLLARTLSAGTAERTRLLTAAVADSDAAYKLRAEAARLSAPNPVAALAGTELALLTAARISPEDAEKPFQVEARNQAAQEATDADVKLRLWREALAIAPSDLQVRLGTLRAALALHDDSLALALEQGGELSLDDRASVAEALAAAAERLNDLPAAEAQLRIAIEMRPVDQRAPLEHHMKELEAELERRSKNAQRQPVIKDTIEQDHPVRPRIARSAQ
jgi:hypothetical protein